ncbi:tyrosine-type recombinase/integrase [Streptacidiphilus sp. PAMC 29251]
MRAGGGWSYTIVWPDGAVEEEADSFLRKYEGSGTQKTYAYTLVDHLRWRVREGLTTAKITLNDLQRYMGAVGAKVQLPLGRPWRTLPKRPYSASGLKTAAACLRGFYLHQCARSIVNDALLAALQARPLPTRPDRALLVEHALRSSAANPLNAGSGGTRRPHPKVLPEGALPILLMEANTARDAMIITWLSDTTLQVGGLTGLHLCDLHLQADAACGEYRDPHLHVCHRWDNPNRAAAKRKPDWWLRDGTICGGEIYPASPTMIRSYLAYMDGEYRPSAGHHGMLLIQLAGSRRGEPMTADAVRGMLRRAGDRAELPGRIKPLQFLHTTTSKDIEVSGDPLVAKAVGNWASAGACQRT